MYAAYRTQYIRLFGGCDGALNAAMDMFLLDDSDSEDTDISEGEAMGGSPQPDKPEGTPEAPAPEPNDPSQPNPAASTANNMFKVVEVDLNIFSNKFRHNTMDYKGKRNLIVRRGQTFTMKVTLDQPFDKDNDVIRLQLAMGTDPKPNKGTLFLIVPTEENDLSEASAVITSLENENTVLSLSVNLPHDSVIGVFKMRINLKKHGAKKFTRHNHEEPIHVLYNPWCKDDDVYMENADEVKEYTLNEYGRLYVGHSAFPSSRPWNFGQFQEGILDAALFLLDSSNMPWAAYGNAIRVTRCLSAKVNCNDDSGVLQGNWSGSYDDGVSPSKWQGSVDILQRYMKNAQGTDWRNPPPPVKYGQCWVFSGILTTVCRALGIPSRSVTNFDSAHDSDGSMTIDTFFDDKGKKIKGMGDSVWNFHVWNEAWLRRVDLPGDGEYDGWQAFDSTPQELSDGSMRCGPASIKAIKAGRVDLGHDARFIFAEVNGDRVTWIQERDGTLIATEHETDTVGLKISTKAVGSDERLDITEHYKHTEGSEEERTAMKGALNLSSRRDKLKKLYDMDKSKHLDMSFAASLSEDATATFTLKAKNISDTPRTTEGLFTVIATYYTGAEADDLKEVKVTMTLEPGEEKEHVWTMTAAEWINTVAEDGYMGVYGVMNVKGTKQKCVWRRQLDLDKPSIECTMSSSESKINEAVEVSMTFTNPLSLQLNKCSLQVEGAGVLEPTEIPIDDVDPNGVVDAKVTITPSALGSRTVMATFHSRQLINITGTAALDVIE